MKTGMYSSIKLNLLMSSLLIMFISGCSKSAEQMCVEAQMNFYDQVKPNTKQRKYFDTLLTVEMRIMLWLGVNA